MQTTEYTIKYVLDKICKLTLIIFVGLHIKSQYSQLQRYVTMYSVFYIRLK